MRNVYRLLATLLLLAPLAAAANEGDAISAVQLLREGGCGGIVPATRPLHHDVALDRAAAHYNGYPAGALSGVHVSGPDSSLVQLLRSTSCRTITDRSLHDLGVYHRDLETWFLLASRYTLSAPGPAGITAKTAPSPTPPSSAPPSLAARALQLVNDVRARGTHCGERSFGPAPPVRLSGILNNVALGHAADMARHDYFEHDDLSGHTPADRVRAVGYLEKLVGENIAYSPGHASRRGLYWVQLLAAPKA
jgi:hypothetical protein